MLPLRRREINKKMKRNRTRRRGERYKKINITSRAIVIFPSSSIITEEEGEEPKRGEESIRWLLANKSWQTDIRTDGWKEKMSDYVSTVCVCVCVFAHFLYFANGGVAVLVARVCVTIDRLPSSPPSFSLLHPHFSFFPFASFVLPISLLSSLWGFVYIFVLERRGGVTWKLAGTFSQRRETPFVCWPPISPLWELKKKGVWEREEHFMMKKKSIRRTVTYDSLRYSSRASRKSTASKCQTK